MNRRVSPPPSFALGEARIEPLRRDSGGGRSRYGPAYFGKPPPPGASPIGSLRPPPAAPGEVTPNCLLPTAYCLLQTAYCLLPMPYLCFPSLEVLTLVLQSQALPGSVQVSPCMAFIMATGELFVQPSQQLTADVWTSLEQFGVKVVQTQDRFTCQPCETIKASCWFELLPLQKCHTADDDLPKTIIFRTASTEKFTTLASEMLRLGNDRIGYRHVASGSTEAACTLIRVIEPPYYTLIDVLDETRAGTERSDATAYREQAPRVWVRMGYQHPLAGRIDPPAGHFLLIDPPHEFHLVTEAAFLDIYQALDVRMPPPAQAWQPAEVATSLIVPLTLTAAGTSAAAELWVIRRDAMQQLEQLVARSDDELLERLAFAVVSHDLEPVVILRVRPSRAAPPILILDATAYCTTLRLPNLFVPVGMRLQPPLRRDAIAKLLASDNRKLTWLELGEPRDNARRFLPFQAQSIPDAAFRPLGDWVEYVLDHHAEALDSWTASHRFEFESFVCRDDVREPTQPSPGSPRSKSNQGSAGVGSPQQPAESRPEEALATSERTATAQLIAEPRRVSTNETIEQLKQVEAEFIQSPEPLDAPSRIEQWLRLGTLHAQLKHQLDATICWANLLWYEGHTTTELAERWLQAELRSSGRNSFDINAVRSLVSQADHRGKDAGLVAAFVVRAVIGQPESADLRALAPELTLYLEKQERFLPARVVWLTALAMHQLVGGDPLGLARVRDRLLNRLYENGLIGELDIVSFLRGGGGNQSDHHRALRARWRELQAAVDQWLTEPIIAKNQTKVYVKFMFAYCLARMGEVINGRELLHQATEELDSSELIHLWMGMAFNYRVDQAAQGGSNRDALPDDLVRQLEFMERLDRYKIDRMRQHSRVLEPHERIDPYRHWHRRYTDELFQTLAELKDLLDLKKVEARLRTLLAEHSEGPRGLRVLATSLEYAPRLGDDFASQLLGRVEELLGQCEDVIEKSLLLHRAVYVAAHFGHTPRVNWLITRLGDELPAIVDSYLRLDSQYNPVDKERIETIENLLQHSFRGLRKLGMRTELSALYTRIAELVDAQVERPGGRSSKTEVNSEAALSRRLSLLLCVASGYYYFGNHDDADRTADKVRSVLLEGKLPNVEQRRLAMAYVQCISLGAPEIALQRIFELFVRLPNGQRALPKIEDTMTTSSHFSVSELEFVEACLLSLLSDESQWDPRSQLWLDQDEFAIRKKIHADMQRALM